MVVVISVSVVLISICPAGVDKDFVVVPSVLVSVVSSYVSVVSGEVTVIVDLPVGVFVEVTTVDVESAFVIIVDPSAGTVTVVSCDTGTVTNSVVEIDGS